MEFNPVTLYPFNPVNFSQRSTSLGSSGLFENMLYLYMLAGGREMEGMLPGKVSGIQAGKSDNVQADTEQTKLRRQDLNRMLPLMLGTSWRLRTLQMFN